MLSLATAYLYYHKPYLFVNNFFHFFVFLFAIIAHTGVAVLTTNVIISRQLGIVNNVFVFYLFQTIHAIFITVQLCALPKRAAAVAQQIRAVWLNCNKISLLFSLGRLFPLYRDNSILLFDLFTLFLSLKSFLLCPRDNFSLPGCDSCHILSLSSSILLLRDNLNLPTV